MKTITKPCHNCHREIRLVEKGEVYLTERDLDGFFHDCDEFRVYYICAACHARIRANGWKWAFTYYERLFEATRRRAILYFYSRGPTDLDGAEAIAVHAAMWAEDDEDEVNRRSTRFRPSFLHPPPWMDGEYAALPSWMDGEYAEDVPGPSGP